MTVIARRPSNDTLPKLKQEMEKNILAFSSMVGDLIKRHGKFYVYGAGHYSLILLKSTGAVPERIFDGNPAKNGKINGVNVELGQKAIGIPDGEPIMVICGYYNDEVIKMLKEMGKKNIIDWRY